jgi:hypothetical protein
MSEVEVIRDDAMVVASDDTFAVQDAAYDWNVAGLSFVSAVNSDIPFERAFARVNKEMVDNSPQPGDQSLDGWWIRSGTDWTAGAGYEFMEPIGEDPVARSFHWSFGVDVWKQGELRLLPKPFRNLTWQRAVSAKPSMTVWGNNVYVSNGDSIFKLPTPSFYEPNKPLASTKHCDIPGVQIVKLLAAENDLLAFTNQGVYSTGTGTPKKIFISKDFSQVIGWYAKDRLIMAAGPAVYVQAVPTDKSEPILLDKPVVVSKDPTWQWTDVAAVSSSILLAGHGSGYSSISELTIAADGSVPILEAPRTVAELPRGELVTRLGSYLGSFVLIATTAGVRLGVSDGQFSYGPLMGCPQVTGPFSAFGTFAYGPVADAGEGRPGLVRFDLSEISAEQKAAWALDARTEADQMVVQSESLDSQTRLYLTAGSDVVGLWSTQRGCHNELYGVIQSGQIRMGSTVAKTWARLNLNGDSQMAGSVRAELVTPGGLHHVGDLASPDSEVEWSMAGLGLVSTYAAVRLTLTLADFPDVVPPEPPGPVPPEPPGPAPGEGEQSWNSLRMVSWRDVKGTFSRWEDIARVMFRSTAKPDESPLVRDWALRSVPSIPRTEMVRLGLLCFDFETDNRGQTVGGEGQALARYLELANRLRSNGPTVLADLNNDRLETVMVDEFSFRQTAAPSRASGFGGVIDIVGRVL